MQRTGSFRSLPTPSPRPMFADLLCASPVAMSDTEMLAPPSPAPARMLTMRTPSSSPTPAPARTPEWLLIRRNLVALYLALYISEAFEAYYYSAPNTATTNTANDGAYAATDAADDAELFNELGYYYDAELRGSLLHDTSFRPFIGGGSAVQAAEERLVIGPIVPGVRSIWTQDADDTEQAGDAEGDAEGEGNGRGTINEDVDSGVDVDDYDVDASGPHDDVEDGEDEDGESQTDDDQACDDEGGEDQGGNSQDSDEDADDEDDEDEDEDEDEDDDDDDEGAEEASVIAEIDDDHANAASDEDVNPGPAPGTLKELLSNSEPLYTTAPGGHEMHDAVGDGRPLREDTDEEDATDDWAVNLADELLQRLEIIRDEKRAQLRRLQLAVDSDWLSAPSREGRNPYGAIGYGRPRSAATTVKRQSSTQQQEQGERSGQENGQRPIRFSGGFVLRWMAHDMAKREAITRPWRELRNLMARQ